MMKCKLFLLILTLAILWVRVPLEAQRAPQPTRALLYSALLPGGGQIYNRAWVKAGLVIGVQGWLIGSAIHNDTKKDEYRNLASEADVPSTQQYYKSMEQEYKNRINNDIWWMGITAALSMVDAFVDAHLYDFDDQEQKLKLRFGDGGMSLQYRF